MKTAIPPISKRCFCWRASATSEVGWPGVTVADVEAGRIDPYDSLYGTD